MVLQYLHIIANPYGTCKNFASSYHTADNRGLLRKWVVFFWKTTYCMLISLIGIGIANGGGTISDMYDPSERADIFVSKNCCFHPPYLPWTALFSIPKKKQSTNFLQGWYAFLLVFWHPLPRCLVQGHLPNASLLQESANVVTANTCIFRYLLGPLLGPSLGPLLGSIILQNLNWPWLFWILLIICSVAVIGAVFFLRETYVPVLLSERKKELESSEGGSYFYEGEDNRSLKEKLGQAVQRPIRILFTQPIVLTMAAYQALLFSITYSLFTQFESIYGEGYGFSTLQVGLVYLGPGLGFLVAVWFLVPRIGSVYNSLTKKHNGEGKPEYRLPVANVGAILIPISIFCFAWTVEYHVHVRVSIFLPLSLTNIFTVGRHHFADLLLWHWAGCDLQLCAKLLYRQLRKVRRECNCSWCAVSKCDRRRCTLVH